MRLSVERIGHVATSGTQSRCQICKSNKLPPRMSQQTQHIDSMGRNRPQPTTLVIHSHSWIIILAFTTLLANRPVPQPPTECKKLNPSLLSLGLNAQTPAALSVHGTFAP